MVQILYFARLRERLGLEREQLTLASGIRDVGGLLDCLRARDERWAEALQDGAYVRVAVNCRLASVTTPIAEGDEVALFPPVTGG